MARTSSTHDALRVMFQVMASVLSPAQGMGAGTRPGRTPAYAVSRGMSQRSTDAWAQLPAPARIGSRTLLFRWAAVANSLYGH